MGLLCLVYQESFCQEVIGFGPSTHYFLVDQCQFANKVVLSNGNDDRLTIEVVNILFNKSNRSAANSQPDYCLTMTVLPKSGFGQYAFSNTMWKKVTEVAISKKTLSYESLQKMIIKTDQYIIEQRKKDTSLIANNGLSTHLRTYNIIPVITSDNEFYIPADADVLTEVFCIDYKPVKPADQVNGHLYLTNTGRVNVDSLLDLSHQLVVNYGSLPEQFRRPSVYYDKYLFLAKWSYKNVYQFVHLQVHRGFIGHYYQEYSIRAYYGVGNFLFSPCIGLVGGTYSSYLRTFYDWIPGVRRDSEVMFTAKSVNGIDFENSIINTCR